MTNIYPGGGGGGFERPTTPNMVLYEDEAAVATISGAGARINNTVLSEGGGTLSRPSSSRLDPPKAALYNTPPDTALKLDPSGAGGHNPHGGSSVWTVEGVNSNPLDDDDDDDDEEGGGSGDEEEDKVDLLEREFNDFWEDGVHKSAGPCVFVSKTLGMLPVIWTEDESESECKSYFNLYTFVVFIGWVGLAVVSALRIDRVENWPGDGVFTTDNKTDPARFLTREAFDTYAACTWVSALTTLLFGVFKCRSFAEVLGGLADCDSQLELHLKHYEKIKRKSLYWIVFLLILLGAHGFALYTILWDHEGMLDDWILLAADVAGHACIFVLDLQFLHFSMVLCKRYRLVNKILVHITKHFKTFGENEQPSQTTIHNILHFEHRPSKAFEAIFEHGAETSLDVMKQNFKEQNIPLELLVGNHGDENHAPRGRTREEENTFILQLDILRGIHADLNSLAQEVNHLLGFQILVHVISSVIMVVMFGYFFSAALIDKEFYWPYLVLFVLPCLRILLVGHWGQVLAHQSRQPFMTICQVSTVDGSPRLERQVAKVTIQMHHQCPTFTAAGYFTLGRNMILKAIGCAAVFTFFMVKFKQLTDQNTDITISTTTTS